MSYDARGNEARHSRPDPPVRGWSPGLSLTAGVNIIMMGAHKTMITHQPLSEINGHSVTRGWQPITAG